MSLKKKSSASRRAVAVIALVGAAVGTRPSFIGSPAAAQVPRHV